MAKRRVRPPISGRLVLDHRLKGETGVISADLVTDLSPTFTGPERTVYVALAPWTSRLSSVDEAQWVIVPTRVQTEDNKAKLPLASHSSIYFPASASSIQAFLRLLQSNDPSRATSGLSQRGIEIHIVDVKPLHLETVYVTVERHLLRDVDEVQGKFGGGFGAGGSSSSKNKVAKQTPEQREERLMDTLRKALASRDILHIGDVIQLPLPSHPITHVPPPPAVISFCEPVSQGTLMPQTKIILLQSRSSQKPHIHKRMPSSSTSSLLNRVHEDTSEDSVSNNEQFYSAGEEKVDESTDIESASPQEESDSDASVGNSSDDSDDSLDDMISLTAPEIPLQPSGVMSVLSSATPRLGGRPLSIHSPGSVLSGFSSSTARQGKFSGKAFKTQPLLGSLPSELLHPKPRDDDDPDAFIFVDVHTLVKIGCFSGDWVRISATEEPQRNMLSSLVFGGLNGLMNRNEEPESWRVAKVYGITGLSAPKLRYSMKHPAGRRSSVSQMPTQSLTPTVLVPPILLHNLDSPAYLKLSPLSPPTSQRGSSRLGTAPPRSSASKSPPIAKEVTLLKISTPLSVDRALQPIIFTNLKHYFESTKRLVKSGDLVGIGFDESLGRTMYSSTKGATDSSLQDDDLLLLQLAISSKSPYQKASSGKNGVSWFRVSHVVSPKVNGGESESQAPDGEQWGGIAAIDTLNTRMVQAGSEISTIPGTLGNTWEYWLSVKPAPQPVSIKRSSLGLPSDPPTIFQPVIQKRIRELVSAATSPRAIQLGMKPVVMLLTSTQRNIGKSTVASRACADIGVHTFTIDSYDILTDSGGASGGDVKTEAYLKARAERAFTCGSACTALLIEHIDVLSADRIVSSMKEIIESSRVVIATTTEVEKVSEGIRSLFTHEIEMKAPDEKEREGILKNAVLDLGLRLAFDVDLGSVALKTAALVAGDLVDVVERAAAARTLRLEKLAESATSSLTIEEGGSSVNIDVRDIQVSGGDAARCVTRVDFEAAVDAARKNFADSIGAPKIPNVTWDDVGGLNNVKDAVMETIQLPLERPELFAKGMKKRSGILFYGPPGTGKTLLAKAIATEFSLNFFSVKGPELLNMYLGESEANVRRVFQRARDARPCVVFFDELDSVAPKRGNQGDSGGVMDRIVSQLLAELDGMSGGDENGGGVFVIGATNRPDLLDSALLRPGRFDKMLYLGVSDTHDKQMTILEALTRKFTLERGISLRRVAEQLPFTYTGADLYALCSDAMLKAITRQANIVDERIKTLPGEPVSTAYYFDHLARPSDTAVVVTEEDFITARNELIPSVSAKELEHFERVRHTFESVGSTKRNSSPNRAENGRIKAVAGISESAEVAIGEAINGYIDRDASDPKGKGKADL